MKKVELLAPVGKFENALAAIENGADAIFVGGKLFNARQFAENFQNDELEQIVHYCKLRGVKTYITVNTLVKNDELEQMYHYLNYLNGLKVDGIIIQDLGVAHLAKTYFPELVLHASTQMTAHSLEDVLFLKSCGFERVVLSRELGLDEIKEIIEISGIEIETFIHGALCYSYSGQCLLSSFIGGRSGNRGRCAQPCRMQYNLWKKDEKILEGLHLMSPKDICTLSILPELVEAGITSFKIEGRMKSPEYVASVVGTYRKYVDLAQNEKDKKDYAVNPEDLANLQSIFNRGGFSAGYYRQKAGKSMITEKTPKNIGLHIGKVLDYNPRTKTATISTNKELHPGDGLEIWNAKVHTGTGINKVMPAHQPFKVVVKERVDIGSPVYLSKNHELLKALRKTYEKAERKLPISLDVKGSIGQPITLKLSYEQYEAYVEDGVLEVAQKSPITKDQALKQFSKLGSTPFKAVERQIEWPENAYISITALNEMRRRAVEILEQQILQQMTDEENISEYHKPQWNQVEEKEKEYVASVYQLEQLRACLEEPMIQKIYWEWQYNQELLKTAISLCREAGKEIYLALPAIMRNAIWNRYTAQIKEWETLGLDGYLCRNYGQFYALRDHSGERDIDYTLNVFNSESISYWKELGADVITISMELSKKELEDLGGNLQKVVYGHIPMMTTEQCILGNYKQCQKKVSQAQFYTLEDRKNSKWPLKTDCVACHMQVLSENPIALDIDRDLGDLPITHYKLQFYHESYDEVQQVIQNICYGAPLDQVTSLGILLKSIE